MKILLLGKTGLLGQALFRVFSNHHIVIAPSHEECDVTNPANLKAVFSAQPFDLVINATGYTKVDDAEKNRDAAFLLNAAAVKNLCQILAHKNTAFVHFSTDYIFDGANKEGYIESDSPAPLSVYGASKAAGEKEILSSLKSFYLIRSSWIFGPDGKNFVDTMIELRHKNPGKPLKVVDDQIGCPTFTLDLAQAVFGLLETKNYGIYHIVNSGSCSWYEFAQEIFHQLGVPQEIIPITSQELNRPAKRPACSILKNTKLAPLRSWKHALGDYLMNKTLIL
ncbi:dTDP-4-dehydrorhamnose reductase [Candidatus Peregrinibacteria bacterium]|nr:dTDP-4-dehydrorhamnose reductase [Candidatus Peregrinibacteria bacterium]